MTATATTTEPGVLGNGLHSLNFVRHFLEGLLEEFPEDKATVPPVPGGNHAMWIIGHLAYCDDLFHSSLAGTPSKFPEEWKPLFKEGSEPTTDAAAYPAFRELRKSFDAVRQDLLGWFAGMSEEKLAEPLPGDWGGFAPNHGALMSSVAAHEMAHVGQLTVVRKALGLPRRFM